MTLDEKIEKLKAGYIAGKTAFQSDEDRGEEFDTIMTQVVANVRSDAYTAFRLMMDSELEEAVRHVRELTWNECCEAAKVIGAQISPDNPYTREAVAKAKQDVEKGDDDA